MTLGRMMAVVAAAALGLVSTGVSAENDGGFYAGAYYFDWEVDFEIPEPYAAVLGDSVEVSDSGTRLVGGYMLNDYVGFELHAASGGKDKKFNGMLEAELDQLVGAFARINMPVFKNWGNVFLLAGYSQGEVEFSSPLVSETDKVDESGLSYGAGLEVAILPERLYVSADYVQYVGDIINGEVSSGDEVEGSATSIGLRYQF